MASQVLCFFILCAFINDCTQHECKVKHQCPMVFSVIKCNKGQQVSGISHTRHEIKATAYNRSPIITRHLISIKAILPTGKYYCLAFF